MNTIDDGTTRWIALRNGERIICVAIWLKRKAQSQRGKQEVCDNSQVPNITEMTIDYKACNSRSE